MDEMEIINLHKRNKARKTPQPKKAPKSPKSPKSSDEKKTATKVGKKTVRKTPQPKKVPKSSEFIVRDDNDEQGPGNEKKAAGRKQSEKPHSLKKQRSHLNLLKQMTQAIMNRSLKKGQAMEKRLLQKHEKTVRKTPRPKKEPKSLDDEEVPQDDKEKNKIPPLLGVKEEVQSFFDLQKDSKNLTIEKKVERVVFIRGAYGGHELSYVTSYDIECLKRVLTMSDLGNKTKDLIKQALKKT